MYIPSSIIEFQYMIRRFKCYKFVAEKLFNAYNFGIEVVSMQSSRVVFFSWSASLGRILTINNLWKRRILVLDWCCMCKRCVESVDHLLLHCPIAYKLWSMVFGLFGINWVMLERVIELFASWLGKFS